MLLWCFFFFIIFWTGISFITSWLRPWYNTGYYLHFVRYANLCASAWEGFEWETIDRSLAAISLVWPWPIIATGQSSQCGVYVCVHVSDSAAQLAFGSKMAAQCWHNAGDGRGLTYCVRVQLGDHDLCSDQTEQQGLEHIPGCPHHHLHMNLETHKHKHTHT